MNVRDIQRRAALGLSVHDNEISRLCSAYLVLLSKYETLLSASRVVQKHMNRFATNNNGTYLLNSTLKDLESENSTGSTAKHGTSTTTCYDGTQSHETGTASCAKPISEL